MADHPAAVTGIGGFFFRSKNPAALAAWYDKHLGINQVPASMEDTPWQQQAGYTVFAPFAADTGYFGDADKTWMLNFRVDDLDALVAWLRNEDITVSDPEQHPQGRFARLVDPEGNPVELWEPAAGIDQGLS